MKKIALWNNYTSFASNQAFNPSAYGIGEDLGFPIILLKEILEKKGYKLETLDMDDISAYEAFIFFDVPNPKTCCKDLKLIPKEKKYLVLEECEMIYKENSRRDLLGSFNKVFTYNDDLVKDSGYIKLNIPNKIKNPDLVSVSEKKFSVVIAGNKTSQENGELYTERLNAIDYMEKKYPRLFDLYGIGWNERRFTGYRIIRAFNKIPFMRTIFVKKHICYRGKIERKIHTLSQYKFCFCYENCDNINGYISEKIFDCFFAGCVPVYYGAPNITSYIPKGCFIDKRDFEDYDELVSYLIDMKDDVYEHYIQNILDFLKSDEIKMFSAEYFCDKIISEVVS